MSYKFVEKKKHKQEEMSYILYMIISSYFHNSCCKSTAVEKSLFLYYKDMNLRTQIAKEQEVIWESRHILTEYIEVFKEMNCEVAIKKADDLYIMRFFTGFESLEIEVDIKGKYSIRVNPAIE